MDIKKEELLLKAIGNLPEEMVSEEDMEDIIEGAGRLQKRKWKTGILYKCVYPAAAVACIAVFISVVIFHKSNNRAYNPGEHISSGSKHNITADNSSNSGSEKPGGSNTGNKTAYDNNPDDGAVNLFAMTYTSADKELANESAGKDILEEDTSESYDSEQENKRKTGDKNPVTHSTCRLKKVPYGSTVQLQAVQDKQGGQVKKYIVFTFDTDFYINISGEAGKSYIYDNGENKKHYIKGGGQLCAAKSRVYFDISGSGNVTSGYSVPDWDKKGIAVTAAITASIEENGSRKVTGTFYIGKKKTKNKSSNKSSCDKEGVVYYGMFRNEK